MAGIELKHICKKCGSNKWMYLSGKYEYSEVCTNCINNGNGFTDLLYVNKQDLIKNFVCDECNSGLCELQETRTQIRTVCSKCGHIQDLIKKNIENDENEHYWTTEEIRGGKMITVEDLQQQKVPEVTCPYCNSTNTKKISKTSKAVNTGLFGIFGTKRHYQWHCDDCDSDF